MIDSIFSEYNRTFLKIIKQKQTVYILLQSFLSQHMKGTFQHFLNILIVLIMFKICFTQNANNIPNTNETIQNNQTKCQKTQYTSLFTKCQLNFQYCNQTAFTYISCFKKQCERYIRGIDCRLWTRLQLSESQCYKQCCGSTFFNQKQCNNYNSNKQITQQSINGAIIAIIIVSAVILIIVAAFLLIKVQKCCQKRQILKIPKYNVYWRNQKFPDATCEICNRYGAFIQTPCQHYFHASCFESSAKQQNVPICPKCQTSIKDRLKIACMNCRQKIYKVRIWKIQSLSQIIKQGRALHDEMCSLSTKSDQLLLPSNKI